MALSLKAKRNCIVDNFGIIGFLFFGRIPVDSSYFSLHFDSILSRKPHIFYFERFKASLIQAYGQLAADRLEECSVLNITLLVGHCILVLC
jgi:hypothetical protein